MEPLLRTDILLLMLCLLPIPAHAWHDETHLVVAKTAGYAKWYNAVGADIVKTKAGAVEFHNHFFNNGDNKTVTPRMVLAQAERYNKPRDKEGHLYGAIVAAIRKYRSVKEEGKYAEYHLAFAVHYAGDLSQPLHNIPYDDFSRSMHMASDAILETEALANQEKIAAKIYPIAIHRGSFEEDLANEIARIAELSRQLGMKLAVEKRNMTKDEAYVQLIHSASLLKALLAGMKEP
jgi:hypothetical protein